MYKFGIAIAGLIGLIVTFQNCAAQHDFSTGTTALNSQSSSSTGIAVATPVTSATPSISSTPAVQCYTYVLNGNANSSGSYQAMTVPSGTQVYQKIACNSRPLNYGYQASYCNGGLASCDSCAGAAGNYVCGTNGYWSLVGSAAAPTATPSNVGCTLQYSGGARASTADSSLTQCQSECRTNANSNPTETVTCRYNGTIISY